MRAVLGNFGLALVLATALTRGQDVRPPTGVALADLSWPAAEVVLTPASVVVIPLGAASVEQGPHLTLGAAEQLARYLGRRVQNAASVVVAPPLTYHYYPSFSDYPGSTSLTRNTARDLTVDVVRSLARSGPRRFYVLNTGISTIAPLSAAAEVLANDGILLGYTDVEGRIAGSRAALQQRPPAHIAHADEIETSMLLVVDPSAVDMTKATREDGVGTGPLTRHRDTQGLYSATGTIGDPTVATVEKGRLLIDALVAGALDDIEKLRVAPLPQAKTNGAPPSPRPASGRGATQLMQNGCTPGDENSIREIGARFSTAWTEMDADAISRLFTDKGDMRHPDGTIERGRDMIRQDRFDLFKKREYRGSSHTLSLNDIRCLGSGHAIADGKWELKLADAPSTGPRAPGSASAQIFNGWCTLVVSGGGETWMIEAWRYTVNPPDNGPPGPTILKTPGWPGRGQ